jgi:photosystem II stability/assembly factor-like uncharacterized protein
LCFGGFRDMDGARSTLKLTSKLISKLAVAAIVSCMFFTASVARAQHVDESHLQGLKWRQIGPFRGGRSLTAVGIPGNPSVFYFGAVSGGIWKTTNGGLTWLPVFDNQPVSSIGSIAVADSDPNVIYAGTGEACIRGNISYGDGVYKSLDAGKTWTNIGLPDSRHIGAVIVDPHDANIVFVAAFGHAYGTNTERGIFRSVDGGKTWEKVLYKDEKTGGIDIVFDPQNSHVLFASMWEAHRTPWSLTSGGPGSGLYRSIDGGTTWKRIEGHGFPEGVLGRIGVSVSGADSNRIYALVEAAKGGLYRSEDGGDSWELVNEDQRFRQRAWYFTHVFADPKSVDMVYVLNTGMFRSTNGGKDFARISGPHGDHHDLWIDPTDPNRMINANDGGATISSDGGKTWTTEMNQPTAQFYHVATDTRFPYHVYGAQQDNTSVAIASDTNHGSIDREDWYEVGGGESGYVVPDPVNPDVVYAGGYWGGLTRFDKQTGQSQEVSPWPDDPDGQGAADLKYRFTWTQPIVISPHDSNTLYFAGQVLFRSKDAGMSWSVVSPDLSRNDKSKQQSSGGPITQDDSSAEFYDLIFTVAESPAQKNVIWAGTDDGLVHITRDGGIRWTSVTPPGVPPWSLVSLIDASWHDGGTAYVAVDAHKLDDQHPYIYRTHKYGAVWKDISAGIPEGSYVHAVREDPERGGLLFAGTETGVFMSFDDGEHWQRLKLNLPTTPVHDLAIKNSDLIVATHGRSFWILDDISPLRQFEDIHGGASAYVFKPRPAIRFRAAGQAPASRLDFAGQTAPRGATLYYWLKDKPAEKEVVSLEILDSSGATVRKFTNQPKKEDDKKDREEDEQNEPSQEVLTTDVGLNRFVWDLRYEKAREIPSAIYDEGDPIGALALPGNYQVKLVAGGRSYVQPLEIRLDPRVKIADADLQKQFELVSKLRDVMDQTHAAVLQMRSVHEQLGELSKRLADDEAAQPIRDAAHELDKKITELDDQIADSKVSASEEFLNYPIDLNGRLGYLENAADSADSAPTQQEYDVETLLEQIANDDLAKWKDLQDKDLAALNDLIAKALLPAVGVPQIEVKAPEKQ